VTVTASIPSNWLPYGAQEQLSLANVSSITALSITVTVPQTGGLSYSQEGNSWPGGAVANGNSTSGSAITFTYVLSGTIPAGYPNGTIWAQFSDNGTAHVTSGDLWTVTTTSGGIASTLTGHF
jgi:hypothetical protein